MSEKEIDRRIVELLKPFSFILDIGCPAGRLINAMVGQKLLINPGKVTPSPTLRPLSAIEQLNPASDGH